MGVCVDIAKSIKVMAVSAIAFTALNTDTLAQEAQAAPAQSERMTAGSIMTNMTGDQRFHYLFGIIDGIAWARFVQDDRDPTGHDCILNWFLRDPRAMRSIYAAFDRYPDASPPRLVSTLANTNCGG